MVLFEHHHLHVCTYYGSSKNEQTEHLQEIAIAFSLKPFNLAKESLVQFKLLKLGSQEYVLLLKMHHIIYDGWSLSIFFGEFFYKFGIQN